MPDLHTNIFILSTPRTGSNLLCECMRQAKAFGNVDGFFAGKDEQLRNKFEQNAEEWLNDHHKNGVHATKASLDYFDLVADYTGPEPIDRFMKRFTHYIVLQRSDKVAQAVSFYLARKSGQWTSKAPEKTPYPAYDYWRILWHMTFSQGLETRAKIFAEGTGCPVLHLWYEHFVTDFSDVVQKIAAFADVLVDDINVNPTLQKQHHPLKEEYITRFNKEWTGRNASTE